MACAVAGRQLCLRCCKQGSFMCSGCHAFFCVSCLHHHRDEIYTQFDNIRQQHDRLQDIYSHHEKLQEYPLFSQIDVWEHDTIVKIQQVAKTIRNELQQLLGETNVRMKRMFSELSDQLRRASEVEDYAEIELAQWKERLMNVQRELETSLHVDIVPNSDLPPIYLIKLKIRKEDIIIQSPSIFPVTQSNYSFENTNISDTKVLQSQLNFHDVHEDFPIQIHDETEIESQIPSDPIENNNLILLQISTSIQSQLSAILNKLNDGHLSLLNKTDDWLTQLKQTKQTTLVIDMSNMLLKDQDDLLNNLSKLKHIHSVYIRGTPPDHDDDRKYFFSKYPIIKAMFESEQHLAVQWLIDTANESKKIGDICIERGDKRKAQAYFAQGVVLYKRLSAFLNEKKTF